VCGLLREFVEILSMIYSFKEENLEGLFENMMIRNLFFKLNNLWKNIASICTISENLIDKIMNRECSYREFIRLFNDIGICMDSFSCEKNFEILRQGEENTWY